MNRPSAILVVFLLGITLSASGQATESDSATVPAEIAWEIQLDEVQVHEEADSYNAALRFFKTDPLSSSDEVVERLPGMWGIRRGGYAFEPVMRGLSAGQITITIDEMRMLGACTDKMDPITSYVEPNNLKQVAVSPGAGGCHSGSTVGGNFDLQINQPGFDAEDPWSGSFGTRILSASRRFESLFSTSFYDGKKFGLRASATYRTADDYQAGGGKLIAFSGYNKVNYSMSGSWQPSPNEQWNLSFIGDNAWDVGYAALPMDVALARAYISGLSYDRWYHGQFVNQVSAKMYYNQVNHEMDDSNRDVVIRMDMPGYTKTAGAFVKTAFARGNLTGNMKLDYYTTFAHADMTMYADESPPMYMLTWPDIRRNVIGLQNQSSWQLGDKTRVGGGVRLEGNLVSIQSSLGEQQLSVFGFGPANKGEVLVNADIHVNRSLSRKLDLELKAAFGQRMPNESEQYGFYLFNAYDGYDYIGRPDLRSEQSGQAEATLKFITSAVSLSLTGYYYRFNRYIMGLVDESLSPMTLGANGVKVYENLDFASLTGMEASIEWALGHLTILNLSKFAYGSTVGHKPLPLIPPFKNNLNLNYRIKGPWHIIAELENATAQNRINSDFGEDATPAYAVMNLMVTSGFDMRRCTITINAGCENITDAHYYEHLDWGDLPRIGRNFTLSLVVGF